MAVLVSALAFSQDKTLDGVTFSDDPGTTYISVKSVGTLFEMEMKPDKKGFYLGDKLVPITKTLLDGTRLVALRELKKIGFTAILDDTTGEITLSQEDKSFQIKAGDKRIEINKSEQLLRAYQGDFLVAETRVSTGRPGFTTPNGTWDAGPEKSRLRYSRKYDNAAMPFSVQITGGYFMHGYHSVPKYPASHGCVRLPMWGANAARWLFSWTDLGTPITISNEWVTKDESTPETQPATELKRSTGH